MTQPSGPGTPEAPSAEGAYGAAGPWAGEFGSVPPEGVPGSAAGASQAYVGVAPPAAEPPRRSWLDRSPLRLTLVLALVGLSALVLLLSGVAATALLRGYLVDQVDARLGTVVNQIEQRLRGDGFGPGGGFGGGGTEVLVPPGYYADVLNGAGESIADREFELGDDIPDLPLLDADGVAALGSAPLTVQSVEAGSADWRVTVEEVPDVGTLVVATSVSDVSQTLSRLVLLLTVIGAGALILLALVGSWVVRRSLRPLEEIESVAEDIAAGDLTRRVPDPDARTEVGRLAGALNGMLARIESAVHDREAAATTANLSEQRMRRFVADASHELRTPLTSIRGFAELYRQGAVPDGPDTGRAMARIESEAGRMNVLVEDMLMLARLDEKRPMQMAPVDLLPLAVDAVYDARAVAPDRQIDLVAGAGPEPMVLGDEARLRQVVGNIVTNALTHTPAGSPIRVTVEARGDAIVLEVMDHGPGLDQEQGARVFERFYRADPARSRAAAGNGLGGVAGGSGLGLAIVAAITAAHHGGVEVDSAPGRGATFRVILPRLEVASAGGPAYPKAAGTPDSVPGSNAH